MGPILDLAVVALAVMVGGTLVTLAWTLAVAIPAALRRTRTDIVHARLRVVIVERRLRERARQRREDRAATANEGDE